ncbi:MULTISPECIES: hypothetical protein [unclassified Leifsonia]|uniref:hypothetical protein n=1 Tax=unclassified Leifsonia TaxID=2663824 RepID=UPI0008A7E0AB|nr:MULTISPECIES: hypothetical protein [unclassified Leifsonia]SEH86376.1 hypothetical protein SAMN04515694_105159 [Leifsonia sp. CL154]SFL48816.1 hypothetical protein SAMN04515692_105159 [Leifsonia sp. CL147]
MGTNPHFLNPAGRLYEFMSATLAAPDQMQLVDAWGSYVGSSAEGEPSRFLAGMGALLSLPSQVRDRVDALPGRPIPGKAQLVRGVAPAEQVLSHAWRAAGMQVGQTRHLFDRGHLTDLETCSQVLNHAAGVEEADDESRFDRVSGEGDTAEPGAETPLEAVRRLAQEILDEAFAANLPGPVAAAFAEYAHAIIRSVDLFHLTGPEGVTREYERFLGGLIRDPELYEAMRNNPGIRDRVKAIAKFITVVGTAVLVPANVALGYTHIYAALTTLLGG